MNFQFKNRQKSSGIKLLGLLLFFGCANQPRFDSETRLKITSELQDIVDEQQLSGLAVELLQEGEVTYSGYFGTADFERDVEINENTTYRIASISKTFTAIAAMQLWDQGKLNLDEDVSTYVGFKVRNPSFPEEEITVRHLLNHTSTIRDGSGYGNFLGKMISDQEPISELFTEEGKFYTENMFSGDYKIGEYFSYSNSAWGLIATAIENISGQRFDNYLRDHVFIPMQMSGRIDPSQLEDIENLSVLYRWQNEEWTPQVDSYKGEKPDSRAWESYEPGFNGTLFGPQGNVRASSKDLVRLLQMFRNNGTIDGVQILSEEAIKEMVAQKWMYNGSNGDTWGNFFQSYGLGVHTLMAKDSLDYIFPGMKMSGHAGFAYGLVSNAYINMETGTGVVLIINGSKFGYKPAENSSFYKPEEAVFEVLEKYLD